MTVCLASTSKISLQSNDDEVHCKCNRYDERPLNVYANTKFQFHLPYKLFKQEQCQKTQKNDLNFHLQKKPTKKPKQKPIKKPNQTPKPLLLNFSLQPAQFAGQVKKVFIVRKKCFSLRDKPALQLHAPSDSSVAKNLNLEFGETTWFQQDTGRQQHICTG